MEIEENLAAIEKLLNSLIEFSVTYGFQIIALSAVVRSVRSIVARRALYLISASIVRVRSSAVSARYQEPPDRRSELSTRVPQQVVAVCVRHGRHLEQRDLQAPAEAAGVAAAEAAMVRGTSWLSPSILLNGLAKTGL